MKSNFKDLYFSIHHPCISGQGSYDPKYTFDCNIELTQSEINQAIIEYLANQNEKNREIKRLNALLDELLNERQYIMRELDRYKSDCSCK